MDSKKKFIIAQKLEEIIEMLPAPGTGSEEESLNYAVFRAVRATLREGGAPLKEFATLCRDFSIKRVGEILKKKGGVTPHGTNRSN